MTLISIDAPTGKANIPRGEQATGDSYQEGGYTYRFNTTTYHEYRIRYGNGYPSITDPFYWTLLDDPFYYPNYGNMLSPWYGHSMPLGYVVVNGEFAPQVVPVQPVSVHRASTGSVILTLVIIVLILMAVGIGVWFFLNRRRRFGSHI